MYSFLMNLGGSAAVKTKHTMQVSVMPSHCRCRASMTSTKTFCSRSKRELMTITAMIAPQMSKAAQLSAMATACMRELRLVFAMAKPALRRSAIAMNPLAKSFLMQITNT